MTDLYYIHDPMCSWCYAFGDSLKGLQQGLPKDIVFQKVLGGLAPDSSEPMPAELQTTVQNSWQRIAARFPQLALNFDFWSQNTPIRSTYPACRAVLAAGAFGSAYAEQMNVQIQQLYYQKAKNPALESILVQAALRIGLEEKAFLAHFHSKAIAQAFAQELQFRDQLGVSSYPSLRLKTVSGSIWPISLDYSDASIMLEEIAVLIEMD